MPEFIDITGRTFNSLTVLKRAGGRNRVITWLARCVCGKEIVTTACRLKSGNVKSCGCQKRRLELTGKKFGRLQMLEEVAPVGGRRRWRALCDCGKEITVRGAHISSGAARSCGCLGRENCVKTNTTHGADSSGASPSLRRTYAAWVGMRSRCCQRSHNRYDRYGGRGIKVCDAWKDSFETFLADMGEAPCGTSIDRKDNDKDYTPDNCRWATALQQAANKSNTLRVSTPDGDLCVAEAVRRFASVNRQTVYVRIWAGWSAEDAVFTPAGTSREKENNA